jgi:hypothetical protein
MEIHGQSKTKLYNVWKHIKYRCLNKSDQHYKWYGAKGVSVCAEWLEFIPFRDWALASGYKEGLYIHRTGKEYSPITCCFVDRHIGASNHRK